MTSKTFKSVTPGNNHVLYAHPSADQVRVAIEGEHHSGIIISRDDAPALALAILEAAGVLHHDPDDTPYEKSERTENMGALNMSAFYLAKHVNDAEKAEFLAKEQAELEAEALELFNASRLERGLDELDWVRVIPSERAEWLAVARKAREINKEDNNGR